MSKSWNILIISKGLIIPLRLQKQFAVVTEKFLEGYAGVDLDKKRTSSQKIQFYTLRLNKKDRVLVTPYQNALVVLSIIEFHQYHTDPYLKKPQLVADFLNTLTHENTYSFTQLLHGEKRETQSLNLELEAPSFSTHVFFTEEQKSLLKSNCRFINGVPGAGKTYLALEEIYNCYVEEGQGTIFYVAYNEALVRQVASMWKNIEALPQDCTKQVKFLTFTQWLQWLFPEEKNKGLASVHSFQEWLKKHNATYQKNIKARKEAPVKGKKKIKKQVQSPIFQDPQLVYKEFTFIHYMTQDEYFKKGVRQTLFSQENRKALWDAFQVYKQHLTQEGLFDPQLFSYTLSEEQADAIALMIFDEYQDLENLAPIIKGSFTRFICFGDGHQQMNPGLAMLPEYYEESAPPLTLTHRFRPSIANFGNAILELKSFMVGGLPKGYYQKIESNFCAMEADFNDNSIILLSELSQEDRRAIADAADLKIITDEKHYPEAIQLFPVEQVYLAHDFKGLESPQILLFKLFDNPTFRETNKRLAKEKVQLKANGPMEYAANRHFIPAFNLLYVAATRGQKLYIYNDVKEAHQFKNLIGFFHEKEIRMIETSFLRSLSLAPQEDVNWLMRVTEALDNNDAKRAKLFFIKHIESSETKWNNFLSEYQEQWCQKNQDLGNLINYASNSENHPINKYRWLNEFDPQVFKEYLSDPKKLKTLFHAQGEALPIFYDLFCQKSTTHAVVDILIELLPRNDIKKQLVKHLQTVYNGLDLVTQLMLVDLASAVQVVNWVIGDPDLSQLVDIKVLFHIWKMPKSRSASPFSRLIMLVANNIHDPKNVYKFLLTLKNYSIDFIFENFLFKRNLGIYGFTELVQSEKGAMLLSLFLSQKILSAPQNKIIQDLMHKKINTNDTLFTVLSKSESQIEILLQLEQPITGFYKLFTKDILMKYPRTVQNLCKLGKGFDFLLNILKFDPNVTTWLASFILKQEINPQLLTHIIESNKAGLLLTAIKEECKKTKNQTVLKQINQLRLEKVEWLSPFKDLNPAALHEIFQSAEEVEKLFTKQHQGLPLFFWLLSPKHAGPLNEELKLLSVHSPIKELIIRQLLTVQDTVYFFHQLFCFRMVIPYYLSLVEGSPWLLNQLNPAILFESFSYRSISGSVFNIILRSQDFLPSAKIETILMQWLDQLKPEDFQWIADEYLLTKKECSYFNGDYGIQILLKSTLGSKILRKLLQSGMRLNEEVCLEIFHKKFEGNKPGAANSIFTCSLKYIDILSYLFNKVPNLYLTLGSDVFDSIALREALPYFVDSDEGMDLLACLFEKSLNLDINEFCKKIMSGKTENSAQEQSAFVNALCHQKHGYRILNALYNSLHLIQWDANYQPFLKIICQNIDKMFVYLLAPQENTSLFFSNKNSAYIDLIETLSAHLNKSNALWFMGSLFDFLFSQNDCGQLNGELLNNHLWGREFLISMMAVCFKRLGDFCYFCEYLTQIKECLTPQKKTFFLVLLSLPIPSQQKMTLLGSTLSNMKNVEIMSKLLQKIDLKCDIELAFSGISNNKRKIIEDVILKTAPGQIIQNYLSQRKVSTIPSRETGFSEYFKIDSEKDIEALFTPNPQNGIPPFCSLIDKNPQKCISRLKKLDPFFQKLLADRLMIPLVDPSDPQGRPRNLFISLIMNGNNCSFIMVLNQCPWLINQEGVKSLVSFHTFARGEKLKGILPIVYLTSSLTGMWKRINECLLAQADFFTDFLFSKIGNHPIMGMQVIYEQPVILAANKLLCGNDIKEEKIIQAFLADDLKEPLLKGFLDYGDNTKSLLFLLNKIPKLHRIIADTLFSTIINKNRRFSYLRYLGLLNKSEYGYRILFILLSKGYLEHFFVRDKMHTSYFAAYLYQLSQKKEEHPRLLDFMISNIGSFQQLLWLLLEDERETSLLCGLFEQDLIEKCGILQVFIEGRGFIKFSPVLISKIYFSLENMLHIQKGQMNLFNSEKNCALIQQLFSIIEDYLGDEKTQDRIIKLLLSLGLLFIENHSFNLTKLEQCYPFFMPLFSQICFTYPYQLHLNHLLNSFNQNHQFIAFILTTPYSRTDTQGKKVTILGQAIENKEGKELLIALLKMLPPEYVFSYSQAFPEADPEQILQKMKGMKMSHKVIQSRLARLEPNQTALRNGKAFLQIWHPKEIISKQSQETQETHYKPSS